MNIIKPSTVILEHSDSSTPEDDIKQLELIGRTAYKSEDKITQDSAAKFIAGIVKSGHESVLEHLTHKFMVETGGWRYKNDALISEMCEILDNTVGFHYSVVPGCRGCIVSLNVRTLRDAKRECADIVLVNSMFNLMVRNYPLLYSDLGKEDPFSDLYNVSIIGESSIWNSLTIKEAIKHISRSVRFICDRGVTHEIVRHRPPSYTQESTRYCNYAKKGVTYIEPPWGFSDHDRFILELLEEHYNLKIDEGWTPQMARGFLPNCLKTEIVMTATLKEWHHFFELRTAKTAHPQMRELTVPLLEDFRTLEYRGFADDIIPEPLEKY